MRYLEHTKNVRRKISQIATQVTAKARGRAGKGKDVVKEILLRVIEPMALYGAEIWGERAGDSRLRRQLGAVERPFLVCVSNCHRTVATQSLEVVAGYAPLHIKARVAWETHNDWTDRRRDEIIKTSNVWRIRNRSTIAWEEGGQTDWDVYVDGSRGQDGTGIGYVMKGKGTQEEGWAKWKEDGSANETEMIAIRWGIVKVKGKMEAGERSVIYTDCASGWEQLKGRETKNRLVATIQEEIQEAWREGKQIGICRVGRRNEGIIEADKNAKKGREEGVITLEWKERTNRGKTRKKEREKKTMERWQREWEESVKGRAVYNLCKEVGLERIELSFKGAQLLTGHGNFKGYISRFKLGETDGICGCGLEEVEDVEHVRERCVEVSRMEAREEIQEEGMNIKLREQNKVIAEQVRRVNGWAERVVVDDDYV